MKLNSKVKCVWSAARRVKGRDKAEATNDISLPTLRVDLRSTGSINDKLTSQVDICIICTNASASCEHTRGSQQPMTDM